MTSTSLARLPSPRNPFDVRELVGAALDGDEAAWQELVVRYSRMIWAVTHSYRLSEEDAADVVQNTWLRLATRLHSIRTPEALPGWLTTTARNECRQLLRGRREWTTLMEAPEQPSDQPGPAEHVLNREMTRLLSLALARLPEREAHLLRLLMQSSRPGYAEIAQRLGMAVGSIGPTRSRALEKLRMELAAVSAKDLRT